MDGYFAPDSMLRRVQGERVVMISGARALLMQAAHPLAVEGLLAHTTGLDDPYKRLERTAQVMSAITFDSRERADRMTARVRKMHERVSGRLDHAVGPFPAGTPYAADDPKLLMWVLFGLVDSGIVVYERFVKTMRTAEKEAYWRDYRVVGNLFGLADSDMPADLEELGGYRRDMYAGGELVVTDWARIQARQIVLDPPLPIALRPLVEAVNFITVALLPPVIRDQYGFSPLPPAPLREFAVAAYAEYVKRGVLPFVPGKLRRVSASRAA
ncbi:MAG: oxygenase MpaB family protein [Solirubrobacterales bacterium]